MELELRKWLTLVDRGIVDRLGVDTLQIPDDDLPPAKFLGVWEVYWMLIVGSDLVQIYQRIQESGKGGKKTTKTN